MPEKLHCYFFSHVVNVIVVVVATLAKVSILTGALQMKLTLSNLLTND